MSTEIFRWSAAELARRIRQKDISCREAMQSCLARMEAVGPLVNAVVDARPEQSLAEADAADALLAKGGPIGPLHGVPVTTKINADQQGWATTHGVVAFKDHIAPEDSAVIASLRRAGACTLGRTNTPAFSLRWFTDNALHGRTRNPRNAQLTPGGSSGGAAAAVACGIGPIAHGNDQGGSVRYPAYACGVWGLRASFGCTPYFQPTAEEWPFMLEMLAVNGPLARCVDDLHLGLNAMSGADARDPWHVPLPPVEIGAGACKVALCKHIPGFAADAQVHQALEQAARWLQDAGYIVEEAAPPQFAQSVQLWFDFTIPDIEMDMGPAMQTHGDGGTHDSWAIMRQRCPQWPDLRTYRAMLAQRTRLRRAWGLFLEQYPLLLLPVSWRAPFAWNAERLAPGERPRDKQWLLDAQSPLLASAALSLPALAAPMPAPPDAPMGVQLIAAPHGEGRLLAAGRALEQRMGPVEPIDPV